MEPLHDTVVEPADLEEALMRYEKDPAATNLRNEIIQLFDEEVLDHRQDITTPKELLAFATGLSQSRAFHYGARVRSMQDFEEPTEVQTYELVPGRKYPPGKGVLFVEGPKSYYRYMRMLTTMIEGTLPAPGTKGFLTHLSFESDFTVGPLVTLWLYKDLPGERLKVIDLLLKENVSKLLNFMQTDEIFCYDQENAFTIEQMVAQTKISNPCFGDNGFHVEDEVKLTKHSKAVLFDLRVYAVVMP
jgi:hypothetical protein